MNSLDSETIQQAIELFSDRNRQAKRQNRLTKKQLARSKLDHQQAERLYLLEKSKLQPSFKLTVSEFLLNKPDFINDPEQAMEADFLVKGGFAVDQRILRFKLSNKGNDNFMRPCLVAQRSMLGLKQDAGLDERLLSITSQVFFTSLSALEVDSRNSGDLSHSFNVYLIYRDQTTLPVLLKFQLTQKAESKLLRWEVEHVDTVFASSRSQLKGLFNATACEQLFIDSYE